MPTQAPPDVPTFSGMSPPASQALSDFLRRLSTWAYQEIDKKVPKDEATAHVILSSSDQKPVTTIFAITVDHTGAITASPIPLGSGKP
jgi:hypothetical protein